MSVLRESGMDRSSLGEYTRKHPKQFSIPFPQSEIEFLHGFEACSGTLDHSDKTLRLSDRGNKGIAQWKQLGRPHPAILRAHLLSLWHWDRLPDSIPRLEIEKFLDWSYEAYEAVKSANPEQSQS
jgi:hypothetical protein